jgi:tetratricopeptide (TPR) repeat protein
MRQGLDEIRRTIREQEPQKPSTFVQTMALELQTGVARHRQADGPKLAGLIRGDLDWIVMKAIEKDRARRYETATALAADLQRHLRDEPVTARPASASYRFRRMIRRNKLAFAAATAVSVTLLVGTGVSTWMFLKEKSARERAVAAERTQSDLRLAAEQARINEIRLRHKAEDEAARSARHERFMKRMWMDVSSRTDGSSNTAIFRDVLDQAARRVIKELHFDPEHEAELRGETAAGFRDVGSYANAEAMFTEALSLRKKMHSEVHVEVARALHNLADVLRLEGKDAEAIPVYRDAIEMRRQLLGNEHIEVAESLFGLAEVSGRSGEKDAIREAEDSARECLRIRENEMPGDWLTFATRSVLGGCLLRQEKYAGAELLLEDAYYGMKAHESQIATAATAGNFTYLSAVPRIAVTDAHPRVPAVQLAVYVRKQQAVESLVALFEATGRLTEAAAWKQQLEELQTPESKE